MPLLHLANWLDTLSGVASHFHSVGHDDIPTAISPHVGSRARAQGLQSAALDPELRALSGKGAVRIDLLNNGNSQYYGDFSLGEPAQRFTAVFDTGSGMTWVPGSKCHDEACATHHTFDDKKSEHFQGVDGSKAAIHYGTGEVHYTPGEDTMTFCDSKDNAGCHGDASHTLSIPHQPFGRSTNQTSYPFSALPFDGILGLAPSGSKGSVLHHLKAAKALARNVFGVYLSEDTHRNGSLAFGGIESSRIARGSPVHWHDIRSPSEWQVSMKDITVDGKPLHLCDSRPDGVCPAVMDTGSSLVTGPTGEVEKLLANIHTDQQCTNLGKMPVVAVQLVDHHGDVASYPLTPAEYTLRSTEEIPGSGDSGFFKEFPILGKGGTSPQVQPRCDPGIGVMDVPGRKWVLGDTFLRRYYSIYDDDRGLVGLVRSVHPDETPSVPSHGTPLSSGRAVAKAGVTSASLLVTATPGTPRQNLSMHRHALWLEFL